jgi:L-2,4-diaminobutyrate decarboxylase
MMGLKVFAILKTYGPQVFIDYFTTCYRLGREFAEMISKDPELELPYYPESNIVCFRILKPGVPDQQLNQMVSKIRQRIIEEGKFYIVQTEISGKTCFRTTLMNPFTGMEEMRGLIAEIKRLADLI